MAQDAPTCVIESKCRCLIRSLTNKQVVQGQARVRYLCNARTCACLYSFVTVEDKPNIEDKLNKPAPPPHLLTASGVNSLNFGKRIVLKSQNLAC